jgi:hypothetical protein
MERLELLLRVVLRIYVGIVLAVLPWTRVWESNRLFLDLPSLGVFACSGSVRGVITGLGLLNLWIALADASERRRP